MPPCLKKTAKGEIQAHEQKKIPSKAKSGFRDRAWADWQDW